MKSDDIGLALAVLAIARARPRQPGRPRTRTAEPHHTRDESGRWYHVDARGTRRRVRDDEEVKELEARLAQKEQNSQIQLGTAEVHIDGELVGHAHNVTATVTRERNVL